MIKLFIYPTIENSNKHNLCPLAKMLTTEQNDLANYYKIVPNISGCDYILNPEIINIQFKEQSSTSINKVIKSAKSANKKVICFTDGDFGKSINSRYVIMLRMGGFKSKMKTINMISAYVSDPYLIIHDSFSPIPKIEKPTVGFVGHSDGTFLKVIKEFMHFLKKNSKVLLGKEYYDYQSFYPSSYYRDKYLKLLRHDNRILSEFICRKKYNAGANDKIEKLEAQIEFFNNIKKNMYTFCLRGSGNFSIRFYETLAMGRIPILVNTDCKLPFEDILNWNLHAIIIPEIDYKSIASYIHEFHNRHTEEELITIQINDRKLWETHFTRNSFYTQLATWLDRQLKNN